MNIFEDDLPHSVPQPKFIKSTDTSYVVIVRFRNKLDYDKFADHIGQPNLKRLSKNSERKTSYPATEDINSMELFYV